MRMLPAKEVGETCAELMPHAVERGSGCVKGECVYMLDAE